MLSRFTVSEPSWLIKAKAYRLPEDSWLGVTLWHKIPCSGEDAIDCTLCRIRVTPWRNAVYDRDNIELHNRLSHVQAPGQRVPQAAALLLRPSRGRRARESRVPGPIGPEDVRGLLEWIGCQFTAARAVTRDSALAQWVRGRRAQSDSDNVSWTWMIYLKFQSHSC